MSYKRKYSYSQFKKGNNYDSDNEEQEQQQKPYVKEYKKYNKPPKGEAGAIYSDGAFNSASSPNAWASVVDSNGNDLIPKYLEEWSPNEEDQEDSFTIEEKKLTEKIGSRLVGIVHFEGPVQQNNGAELVALLLALRLAAVDDSIKKIYSDSEFLLNYWSKGHVKSETWKAMPTNKQQCITECKKLRKDFEDRGGKIEHVHGGYNLADLGFHKEKYDASKTKPTVLGSKFKKHKKSND